jgi:hypothetical protein
MDQAKLLPEQIIDAAKPDHLTPTGLRLSLRTNAVRTRLHRQTAQAFFVMHRTGQTLFNPANPETEGKPTSRLINTQQYFITLLTLVVLVRAGWRSARALWRTS